MEFDAGSALVAGLVATLVITVLMYVGKAVNAGIDMPRMLGLMFAGPDNIVVVYVLGLLVHFAMGAFFGLLYGWAFQNVPPNWIWGGLFGAVHGMVAGFFMGMMPSIHPRMGEDMEAQKGDEEPFRPPGLFGKNYGLYIPVGFVLLHIIFGLVVGWMYVTPPPT